MNKYDCNKTVDFAHEIKRMCCFYGHCSNRLDCPLLDKSCDIDDITPDIIEKVQKWSDKHPEKPPKLTRKDYDFLSGFKKIDNRYIYRSAGDCRVLIPDIDYEIGVADGMFAFIQEGIDNGWSFEDLFDLEIEDE